MTGCTIAAYAVVVKDTGGKYTRGMAYTTILGGRHMVARLTSCVSPIMAGSTQFMYDARDGVIESFCPGKGARIVSHATIGIRCRMICCFAYRVSTIVTGFTITGNCAVVKDNGLKIIYDMTPIALAFCRDMSFMFTCSHSTVVADVATSGNARVIITAVSIEFDKASGIVTVVTFHIGFWVLIRLANGPYTVMTLTAYAKNFQVIYEWNNVKAERGMTGCTQITSGKVIG